MNESARCWKKSLFKKQQQWIEHEQLCNSTARFKNKSYLPLALHQWPSLGKRAWPLRKSTAHTTEGEQWTTPRRPLQNNALSISALRLAQPTIPATQFPGSQRDAAWCAPGHCVPITSRVGEANDPNGSDEIEPFMNDSDNGKLSPDLSLVDPGTATQHDSSTFSFDK